MHRTWPLLMVALVTLFLAEGQRSLFAYLFGPASDALLPVLRPAELALALLPFLTILAAPFLPLARWLDRGVAVAAAAMGVALFRLLMTSSALEAQLVGGTLVVASGAVFLTWAVGHLDRRAMAGGIVVGLAADQLLRLAGSGYDLSLQLRWLPAPIILTLVLMTTVVLWARGRSAAVGLSSDPDGLERRGGGLRMRGGLALGALLFLDLHVLGLPPVVAHWTGIAYPAAGLAVGVASATGVAAVLLMRRPTGGRTVTLALVALVTAGALAGYWEDGVVAAGVMAGGHFAALLLASRALDPASGRRSGATVAAGLALFALATALYSVALFDAPPLAALAGWTPWIFVAVGLLLAGCFILLPRGAPQPAPGSRLAAAALAVLVALAAIALFLEAGGPAGGRTGTDAPGGVQGGIRVATWSARYGFDGDRRFDPRASADSLRALDADVVAIRDAPVGAPAALGVNIPHLLGRRAGLTPRVPSVASGRPGDAFLVRPGLANAAESEPSLLRFRAAVDGVPVTFVSLPRSVDGSERTAKVREALESVGPGPAVVIGGVDLRTEGREARMLARADFHNVSPGLARDPGDDSGSEGIDQRGRARATAGVDRIWVRGLRADTVAVRLHTRFGHSAVVATLHILDGWIRSTDANDLQTP